MTAADLVAGARALIEPLTGHTPGPWEVVWNLGEVYSPSTEYSVVRMDEARDQVGDMILGPLEASDLKIIAASPVMRDTIAALLDDRDALRQRIEALEAALAACADDLEGWIHDGYDGVWSEADIQSEVAPYRAALQADEVAP